MSDDHFDVAGVRCSNNQGGMVTARQAARRTTLCYDPAVNWHSAADRGRLSLVFSDKTPLLNAKLTHVYSLFSHVLWPAYVPIAVLLLEPVVWRRKLLIAVALAGATVALYLPYFLVRLPIASQIVGQRIVCVSPHFYAIAAMGLNVVGTSISMFFSNHRAVRLFGIAAVVSFVAAYGLYATWFISVWCFFAAVLRGIVLLQFPKHPESCSKKLSPKF